MQKIAPYTQLESCKCIITVACHVVILRYTFAAGNGHPTLLESLYISTFVHVYGVYIYNKCISVYLHYSLYFYLDYSFLCIHGGPTGMVVANMAVDGPFFQPANVEDTGSHHSWL